MIIFMRINADRMLHMQIMTLLRTTLMDMEITAQCEIIFLINYSPIIYLILKAKQRSAKYEIF